MGGTTTHLIRADQNTTSLPFSVDLFVVSEDCDAANSEISESLSYADIEIKNFICDSGLFADRD
jgi:hypothetical protein